METLGKVSFVGLQEELVVSALLLTRIVKAMENTTSYSNAVGWDEAAVFSKDLPKERARWGGVNSGDNSADINEQHSHIINKDLSLKHVGDSTVDDTFCHNRTASRLYSGGGPSRCSASGTAELKALRTERESFENDQKLMNRIRAINHFDLTLYQLGEHCILLYF